MTKVESTKDGAKKPLSKLSIFGILIGVYTVINLLIFMVGGIISYPTQAHRDVANNYAQLLSMGSLDDPKLKALEQTPEMAYSNLTSGIIFVISVVVWLVFVGLAYNYLRKRHIVKEPALAVALIDGGGTVLAAFISLPLTPLFGYPTQPSLIPGLDPTVVFLIGLPFTFVFSVIITYLAARVFQWRYNRKYNFEVE